MNQIKYHLKFRRSLHIGSGAGVPGFLDEKVLRDHHQFPYIPRDSIKGILRQSLADLIHYQGKLNNSLMCAGQQTWHKTDQLAPNISDYCRDEAQACLMCKLFGSPVIQGALQFSPAEYAKEYRDEIQNNHPEPIKAAERDMAYSAHASIDKHTGRAKDKQLFNLEIVQPVIHFEGSVTANLPIGKDSQGQQAYSEETLLGWLTAALLFTRAIGSRRRRGWGECRFEIVDDPTGQAANALRKLLGDQA